MHTDSAQAAAANSAAPDDSPDAAQAERSPIDFPKELPISSRVADIARAIAEHPVVIVAGATGSGKTTQLPKIALAMGRGLDKMIGVTQPRRLAATSVAARVAEELGSPLGTDVGYQIRFEDRTSASTYVKFMTDGILLAETQGDPLLARYDTLIIDEAHERSLNIDFLLGWIKRMLPQRPDLKVVISSATLETERFSKFFGDAPVIQVEGRTYPVGVLYEPPDSDTDLADAVADAVANVTSLDPHGDILVFLPGEREIRECEGSLRARNLRHTTITPLYGRLTGAEQAQAFVSIAGRRVILATNVAETSITLPGIVYVIDSGSARLSRYEPRSGITRLQLEGISQASADQRKGRCGRVREGVCIRLYDEQSFAARQAYTDPEIKRSGLAGVILRMLALGLGDVEEFPFLDPPAAKSIAEGYRVLEELGALGPGKLLTPLGKQLARLPLDPRIGRMVLAGAELGCLEEVIVVASALSLQDPRERPREHAQRADDLHRRFRDEHSDFASLLRLWAFVKEAGDRGSSQLRRTCKEHFLSFMRVREWGELYRQLRDICRDLLPAAAHGKLANRKNHAEVAARADAPADKPLGNYDAFHAALLTGLLSKVGQWNTEHRIYVGSKQTRFAIHPSSGLARKSPPWIMAAELYETSQLFARMVARVDPEWLAQRGAHLLKRSYGAPNWSEKSARASIKESSTLFGLQVMKDRSVDYASIAPGPARLMFLDHALVRGEYLSRGKFQARNQELMASVARLRDKARQSDMLADDDALLAFFDKRVPAGISDGRSFETWRESAETADPKLLWLKLEDVLTGDAELKPEDFPDVIRLHGTEVKIGYLFDPASSSDGITLSLPLVLLPQLSPGELDWTIRGWLKIKLAFLLGELPKAARRELGTLAEISATVANALMPFSGAFIPAVIRAVEAASGVRLHEEQFRLDLMPTYLRCNVRVLGADGKLVAESREVDVLLRQYGAKARAVLAEAAPPAAAERTGLTQWNFGILPDYVIRRVGGAELRGYPALLDKVSHVDLAILEAAPAAFEAHLGGVRRLVGLNAKQAMRQVEAALTAPFASLEGKFATRAEDEAFRARLRARIIGDAFGLSAGPELPRSQSAFDACIARGAAAAHRVASEWTQATKLANSELLKTLQVYAAAQKHPSATAALIELRAQLRGLFTADLLEWVPLAQLMHYPRYLRAGQARVGRALGDPQKDAAKASAVLPLWKTYADKRDTAKDRVALNELRWHFEELRVSIFAPELKTALPVSLAKLGAALAQIR